MADKRPITPEPPSETAKPRNGLMASLRPAVVATLADPFRLALTLAVNVAIVVGIVGTAIILRNHKPPPKPPTAEAALSALDRGKMDDARDLAGRLAAKRDIKNEEWGVPDFVLGSLAAQDADAASGKARSEAFRQAALYLLRSRERGFPAGREAAGLYLLGKSLSLCGRLDDALPVLEEALRAPGGRESELRTLLISALTGVHPPELEKALAETGKLLADPQLSGDARSEAQLDQARILLRLDRTAQCAALLDKLPNDPLLRGHVSLLRGRLALSEGLAAKKAEHGKGDSSVFAETKIGTVPKAKFQLAIDWLRKAIGQDAGDNRIARQANYLIGVCLAEQGDLPAALAQTERTARLYPESPECVAAWFQEATIARRMGRHSEAVKAFQRLMSAYSRYDEFHNPWINAPQIEAAIQEAWRDYLKSQTYETAVLLSKLLAHLIPKADALKLTAEIYRTWGENLMEEAEHLSPDKAERRRKEARLPLRRAGDTYTELARELFTTHDYADQLWNGAAMYFAGHDFRSAARLLRTYLKNETHRRLAQALTDLGEAELSLGETEQALRSFQECIEQHSRDVAVYRARLLASRAAIMLGNLKEAESYLQANLDGELLTPAAKEWRDSLFALGDLLHLAARDAESIPRLEEALRRYPDAPQAISARYLLADSSRRLALALRGGLSKEISAAARSERRAEINGHFARALQVYSALQNELSRRDAEDMTEQEKAVLRNARFALGDVYLELDRHAEALRAYQSAANHYANRPEVLDAYLQIANVYRRMDRPAEARTSLEQARIALRRIPAEARFEQSTNFNRKQWGDLLDRLCSL
jgi:tetratricopeptide (TPR) repeat protein